MYTHHLTCYAFRQVFFVSINDGTVVSSEDASSHDSDATSVLLLFCKAFEIKPGSVRILIALYTHHTMLIARYTHRTLSSPHYTHRTTRTPSGAGRGRADGAREEHVLR
jgi:hypothetical protein